MRAVIPLRLITLYVCYHHNLAFISKDPMAGFHTRTISYANRDATLQGGMVAAEGPEETDVVRSSVAGENPVSPNEAAER